MTDKQSRKLYVLGRIHDIHIPFVIWGLPPSGQKVSKMEAAILIDLIENGTIPSEDYINSLGYGPEVCLINPPALDCLQQVGDVVVHTPWSPIHLAAMQRAVVHSPARHDRPTSVGTRFTLSRVTPRHARVNPRAGERFDLHVRRTSTGCDRP